MTPKILKQFDELEKDLRLCELEKDLRLCKLENFADRVQALKAALQPKPKAVAVKAKTQALKLEITENGKVTEVLFDDEKKAEAFLKLKQKQRLSSYRCPEGLSVPNINYYGGSYAEKVQEYKRKEFEYWQAAAQQGTDFTVKISKA